MKQWKRWCCFHKFTTSSYYEKDVTEMQSLDDMLRIRLHEAGSDEEIFTYVAWISAFSINEPIYTELCHEFYSTYEFDKVCVGDELQSKKIIRFRLGGRAHNLTLLEFARRLRLYQVTELEEEGFNVYFEGEDVVRSLSALIYYRDLDTITLRDLIDSDGKLILEDPQPGVPRVANVDQAKDTSAQDNQETASILVEPKEMPELPSTSFSLSVSSGFEVPQIQSPTLFNVRVSVIPKQSSYAPSLAFTTETPITTILSHPPSVTTITSLQQQTTPIPTSPITTVALIVTTAVPDPLLAIVQRLSIPESQFEAWKQVDHLEAIEDSVQANIINEVKNQLPKGDVNPDKVLRKRDRGDNDDEDPSTGPKKTKMKRTKESKSSKKSSTLKDTSKGNIPPKTLTSDKFVHAKESVAKSSEKVILDAEDSTANDDVVNGVDQPQDDSVLKTDTTPKNNWFKQPSRPSTPDPEWNKVKAVDDTQEPTWFNDMLSAKKDPLIFDEIMATPIDFAKFAMNHLKIEKLTKADLVGLVYELLKGTCQSSIELEYKMEECYKSLTGQLD
uniref:Retrovirus-related Pol polyprotein from transposon TNT 1-94 n=1 Tax=Tanacetum cinerariifolium TaxID=118510 RepID=A0A6L2MJE6_TANCI|nr:hypothetical protein [Tanacetum cinerariifolium]